MNCQDLFIFIGELDSSNKHPVKCEIEIYNPDPYINCRHNDLVHFLLQSRETLIKIIRVHVTTRLTMVKNYNITQLNCQLKKLNFQNLV